MSTLANGIIKSLILSDGNLHKELSSTKSIWD